MLSSHGDPYLMETKWDNAKLLKKSFGTLHGDTGSKYHRLLQPNAPCPGNKNAHHTKGIHATGGGLESAMVCI